MTDFGNSPSLTRLPHLSLLLAFKTVAEHGSFTRAAKVLHLSQSAVSQQVVKLEEVLEAQLFERTPRAVVLTFAGQELLNDIGNPFESLVTALNRCARRDARPVIHIETEPMLSAFWLTPRLKQFTQRFPDIWIQQIQSTHRLEFPENVELGIKWGDGKWPGLNAEMFFGVNYVPVCSPALMDGPKPIREPSDLARHALLHYRNYQDWERWHALYPAVSLQARSGHVVTDANVLAQLAIEEYGVALCAVELIDGPVARGELVVPFPEMRMQHSMAYYILTRPNVPLSPTARSFVEWLRSLVAH